MLYTNRVALDNSGLTMAEVQNGGFLMRACLRAYHWPENIRELQSIVERAVILNETDTLVVDESWLKRESADSSPREGLSALANREVEMIETALAESRADIRTFRSGGETRDTAPDIGIEDPAAGHR
jgi:transcriptional regulator with PAS, ATPase and Fis domain